MKKRAGTLRILLAAVLLTGLLAGGMYLSSIRG